MKQLITTALAAWLAGNLAAGAVEELRVTLKGGGISGTFPVTPTETSCGRLNWDGLSDKDGSMSGGQCEITVQLLDKSVVLKEHTLASDKGIRSDIIAKTFVPTDKVPWTGKISQTTVSVFRVEPDKDSAKEGGAIRLESNRDAATLMPRIRAAIEAGPMFEKLSEILGEPDVDIGSGIHIFVYRLSDGTGITVGTPDKKRVMYIEHANKRLFPIEKEQGTGPVIKRGDRIGKHLGDGTPLTKNYGESKQLLDSPSSVWANTEVMMWKVGDGTLVIATSLGVGFIVDINYVITDSKDEKRTTLKVKDFNPSTGEMTLAIPTSHDEQSQRFTMIWRETSVIPIEKVPTPQGFKVTPVEAVKPIMARSTRAPWAEFYLIIDSANYYFGNTRKGAELTAPQPGHYVIDGMTGKITEPKPDGGKRAP